MEEIPFLDQLSYDSEMTSRVQIMENPQPFSAM